MFTKKSISALTIFISSTTYSLATPSVSSVEGSSENGAIITLKGSGFSAGTTPILWDTTDNQNYSNILADGEAIPTDGLWSENSPSQWANSIVLKKTGDLRTRFRSSVYSNSGGKKGYLGWPNIPDTHNKNTLYVTWWFKANISISDAGGSNKVVRVWDASSGENTRISWTSEHMTADTENYSAGSSWKNWGGETNQWNRLEIWVDGVNNRLKTWTNGKLIHNYTNFKKSTISDSLNIGLIGFDPSISDNYPGIDFSMSDIYASRSISRVELSDKSTWSSVDSLKEIQPVISWSGTEIEIQLNPGNINLEKAYIYVVDQNGDVNSSGYPLCSNCPIPPDLSIE